MNTLNVVEAVFFAALEKQTPEERGRYLNEACGGDANLRRTVEELAPTRSMSRHPLFQVRLTLQNLERDTVSLPQPDAGSGQAPAGAVNATARFDLGMTVVELFDAQGRPAGLNGTVVASADLFDESTAQRITEWFVRVLRTVTAAAQVRLHAVDLQTGQRAWCVDIARGQAGRS